MGVVDDCDPNKWSKVEIEAICKEFGYTFVNRLWHNIFSFKNKNNGSINTGFRSSLIGGTSYPHYLQAFCTTTYLQMYTQTLYKLPQFLP